MSIKKDINTNVAVIVAHPDDETLWAGGTILKHPDWNWYILALSRGDDNNRAPKFKKALKVFHADGALGTLDDSPEQPPLEQSIVQNEILTRLPNKAFELIITHDPHGEYTRHRRHEETSIAVISLLQLGALFTRHLWIFAYHDGGKKHLPRARKHVDYTYRLPKDIWLKKHNIITEVYGFPKNSFEARITPRKEAFLCFGPGADLNALLQKKVEINNESTCPL